MKPILQVLAFLLLALAVPCLNDRDTLEVEAMARKDLAETIVGRFDRNPPLYYSMRIARLQKLAKLTLDDYDDLAVALDRLGRDEEAIQVMARKKADLDRLAPGANMHAWYTYHANLGTFQAHLWIHNGAKVETIDQLLQGRWHINKAMVINPEAHYGREFAQRGVMDWLLAIKTKQTALPLGEWLAKPQKDQSYPYPTEDYTLGLQGLILLGGAWQSVDIYQAIQFDLAKHYAPELSVFVGYAVQDLLNSGKKGIVPATLPPPTLGPGREAIIRATYDKFRANAEAYTKNRDTFLLAKLQQGKHPDTDPTFMDGYVEVPKETWPQKPKPIRPLNPFYVGFFALGVALAALFGFLVLRVRRLRAS